MCWKCTLKKLWMENGEWMQCCRSFKWRFFFSESIKRNNKSTVWCVHISSWTITFFRNSIYIWFAKCLNKAKKYIRIIWSLSLGSFGLYTNNGIGNDKLDRTKVQNHFFFLFKSYKRMTILAGTATAILIMTSETIS